MTGHSISATGTPLWRLPTANFILGDDILVTVEVPEGADPDHGPHESVGRDVLTGEERWRVDGALGGFIIDDIILGLDGEEAVAFSAETGDAAWSTPLEQQLLERIVVVGPAGDIDVLGATTEFPDCPST